MIRQSTLTSASARQMMGEDELDEELADAEAVELEELKTSPDDEEDGLRQLPLTTQPSADSYSQMLYNTEDDEEENCWTHGPTATFCTPRWFAVFLCLYVLVQSMVVTGLFSASVSTIERRYELSSLTTGLMASTYELTFLVFATAVGYHGGKGHAPRWLGTGVIVLVVGALVFVSPEFFGDSYQAARYFSTFCFSGNAADPSVCADSVSVTWLFFFGMALMALGSTPLYTVGPAYLDNVVKHKVLPLYLGFFYACAALGPAIGFALGFVFLGVWVEPGAEPDDIDEDDPYWVGAWWLGFSVAALVGLWCAVPLLMYPKWVPGTSDVRERNRKQHRVLQTLLVRQRTAAGLAAESDELDWWMTKSFRRAVRGAATNRPFVLNALGQAFEAFAVTGFAAFLPKAGQAVFRLTASEASISVGLVLIPGAAGGIFFGGWMMRRHKVNALKAARYTFFISVVALLLLPGLLIGCGTLPLAGVTEPYPQGAALPASAGGPLLGECNDGCRCDPDRYKPVCGSDGLNYFSACHAGCDTERQDCADETHNTAGLCNSLAGCQWNGAECEDAEGFQNAGEFFSCSCMAGGNATAPTYVTDGRCNRGCSALPWFLFMLFFIMFFTFLNNVPATTVVLRVLKFDQRPVGLGMQNVLFRLLGSIPGPIVFGLVLDSVCVLRTEECGKEVGSCNEYDTEDLRLYFFLLAFFSKLLSVGCFYLSWRALRRPDDDDQHRGSVFGAADGDRDGAVTAQEVVDFLRFEVFLGNPVFAEAAASDKRLRGLADQVVAIVDRNGDGQIQREELAAWLASLPPDVRASVRGAVTDVTDERRAAAIDRVVAAIDTNRDGRVSRAEVRYWLTHERAWRDKTDELMRDVAFRDETPEQVREDLLREIDGWDNGEDEISRDDLENFFSRWTVRDMMMFTEDQRFYRHLERHASGEEDEEGDV